MSNKSIKPTSENNGASIEVTLKGWEEKGIKSKLTGLTIAPEDFNFVGGLVNGGFKADGHAYFTWEEAAKLEEEVLKPYGWRLPTRREWALIVEEFGNDECGELRSDTLSASLGLAKNGCKIPAEGIKEFGEYGYYWSRTPYSYYTRNAYDIYLSPGVALPQDNSDKHYGFSIRLVKENNEELEKGDDE